MLTAIFGMHDILPVEVEKWRFLEGKAREVFSRFRFSEIRTPLAEKTDLFIRTIGETTDIVEKEMYTFQSGKDETISLRPEGTASVVRAYIEHSIHAKETVSKLYYIGPMFRRERPQKGRYRQFHQAGAEILGTEDPSADAEIITMLWMLLMEAGIEGLVLETNSLGCGKCRPKYIESLRTYAQKIEASLCGNCQRRLKTNPLRLLDCKEENCNAAMKSSPVMAEFLCTECSAHFSQMSSILTDLSIPFVRNHSIVRGLDYYTRTAFEVKTSGTNAQNAVAGGGRYDGLVKDLGGPDVSGVGFALGMERIISVLKDKKTQRQQAHAFIAAMGEPARKRGIMLLQSLRKAELSADMAFGEQSLKSQMRKADKSGARYVLILGQREIDSRKIVIKDMKGSEGQKEIQLEDSDVIECLKKVTSPEDTIQANDSANR